MSRYVQKILIGGCSVFALYTASKQDFYKKDHLACEPLAPFHKNGNSTPKLHLPTRNAQLAALRSKEEYDILVIGGGATGAGVALDSISRGLKTALVELDDFSSGTSSRSTKLIHGGVRYLQKAILHLDIEQYRMVKEALHERTNLIKIAPHLSQPLPIMLPIYRLWQVPYYWIGIKAYDLVAWKQLIRPSYYVSRERALELFPTLKKDKLVGAIIYYDGQHNDARMNLSIIITAARMGAKVANHVAVTSLLKKRADDGKETVCGVKVKDMLTGLEWDVYAKAVINATGPFTDSIRKMDNEECTAICQPSSGVHVVLPNYYSPANMGLLDPATSDGRVVFLLPWQNMTLAGTTDRPCSVTHQPSPAEDDILFILKELKNYLIPEISLLPWDVKSAWSGIRPLVVDPSKDSTESIARNHVLQISDSNLITIAGGKWTTYRIMAKDAVDAAVETCNLKPESGCQTDGLLLEGAKGWTPNMYIKLVQYYDFDTQVARHLANTYGDRAFAVAGQESLTGEELPRIGKRLHERFPYIEAEVRYAVTEYACTAVDVIARRLRIAFLDADAAVEVIPTVIEIMADVLKWDETRQNEEYKKARQFIDTEMRGGLDSQLSAFIPHIFTQEEIDFLTDRFYSVYTEKKGYMTFDDLKIVLESVHGENVDEDILHIILDDLDVSEPYQFKEYLLKSNFVWVFEFLKQERGPSDFNS